MLLHTSPTAVGCTPLHLKRLAMSRRLCASECEATGTDTGMLILHFLAWGAVAPLD